MSEKQSPTNLASTGEAPALLASDAVVVYDPKDGRVRHLHHSLVFEGGHRAEPESLRRTALEQARRLGCAVDGLATLHVRDFVPPTGPLCVDLARHVLVSLSLPAAARVRLRP
jgi:hypothetical protein